MPAGLWTSVSSSARAYSAQAPDDGQVQTPKTSSPGANRVTVLPVASTVPAMSNPGTPNFGPRRPLVNRTGKGEPRTPKTSPMWSPAAWTRTSTSRSPIAGRSISRLTSTSGPPYRSWTIACTDLSSLVSRGAYGISI